MMDEEKFQTLHELVSKAIAFRAMVEHSQREIANAEIALRMERDGLERRERVYSETAAKIKSMGYHDVGHARGEMNKELAERGLVSKL